MPFASEMLHENLRTTVHLNCPWELLLLSNHWINGTRNHVFHEWNINKMRVNTISAMFYLFGKGTQKTDANHKCSDADKSCSAVVRNVFSIFRIQEKMYCHSYDCFLEIQVANSIFMEDESLDDVIFRPNTFSPYTFRWIATFNFVFSFYLQT